MSKPTLKGFLAVAERGGADLLEGARQPQGPPATENL